VRIHNPCRLTMTAPPQLRAGLPKGSHKPLVSAAQTEISQASRLKWPELGQGAISFTSTEPSWGK